MRSFPLLVLSVVAFAGSAQAAAPTVWQVTEGRGGQVKGTWTVVVNGDKISGNADVSSYGGRRVTFGLAGEIKGGEYFVHRVQASDGSNCMYHGKAQDDLIANGMAICNGVGSGWIVKPAKQP